MRCFTVQESREWCESRGIDVADSNEPIIESLPRRVQQSIVRMELSRVVPLARVLASVMQPFEDCLLWVTLWGVWSSSENAPLFDRLRGSYDERRPLHECPGLLFSAGEESDLLTFVQIALTSGWNFFLVPSRFRCGVFVSHDEYIQVHAEEAVSLEPLRSFFESSK